MRRSLPGPGDVPSGIDRGAAKWNTLFLLHGVVPVRGDLRRETDGGQGRPLVGNGALLRVRWLLLCRRVLLVGRCHGEGRGVFGGGHRRGRSGYPLDGPGGLFWTGRRGTLVADGPADCRLDRVPGGHLRLLAVGRGSGPAAAVHPIDRGGRLLGSSVRHVHGCGLAVDRGDALRPQFFARRRPRRRRACGIRLLQSHGGRSAPGAGPQNEIYVRPQRDVRLRGRLPELLRERPGRPRCAVHRHLLRLGIRGRSGSERGLRTNLPNRRKGCRADRRRPLLSRRGTPVRGGTGRRRVWLDLAVCRVLVAGRRPCHFRGNSQGEVCGLFSQRKGGCFCQYYISERPLQCYRIRLNIQFAMRRP
mmetsp:Transcript_7486/g.15505  ORF Transcript_7486/g.15505 Transcript_7486/m.15505 type:complete len:361 (-) Transcript_7486:507-1589(-)